MGLIEGGGECFFLLNIPALVLFLHRHGRADGLTGLCVDLRAIGVLPSVPLINHSHIPFRGAETRISLKRSTPALMMWYHPTRIKANNSHALGLPVRGQKTRNNAQTAKKLNRVERRRFGTFTGSPSLSSFSSSSTPTRYVPLWV